MQNGDFQRDLFGGQVSEKKRKGLDLLEKYSRQRLVPNVRIPLEYTVIMAIGVLVLVIVAYAVGIEAGKRAAGDEAPKTTKVLQPAEVKEKAVVPLAAAAKESLTKKTETVKPPEKETVKVSVETAAAAVKDVTETDRDNSVYVIQLASFKDEASAKDEADALRLKGINARFKKSGGWYQVFVAGYRTIGEARADRRLLSEEYVDCYIRKIK